MTSPVPISAKRLSFDILHAAQFKMRANLPASLLLSAMLAACASTKDTSPNANLAQTGTLKVHPGLVGQPVPTELQQETSRPIVGDAVIRVDELGLMTQRSVYFDANSTAVKADYEAALQTHGRYLASHPNLRVRIEGHADDNGSAAQNATYGLKRAENVRQIIISNGASPSQISVKTMGNSKPSSKARDEASRSVNRRVDVVYEKEK